MTARRPAHRLARLAGVAAASAAVVPATGCGVGSASDDGGPAVDSAFVEVLAEVHLADARAALAPDSLRAGLADSLREAALRAHSLDDDALDARVNELAEAPDLARATYDAVADRLSEERRAR